MIAEGDEAAEKRGEFGGGDGETAERRRLLEAVSIRDYLGPAGAGGEIRGAAAELAAALEVPTVGASGGVTVPWEMFAGVPLERRDGDGEIERRAFTTTATGYAGGVAQRPILQRLFGPGIMDQLGVRIDSVPAGRTEWPLITGGVAPAQAVEGTAAADAVTAVFTTETLKPKRLTGRYEFTHEQAAQVPDIEQALRRDLADAVLAQMSVLSMTGKEATNAHEPNGFLTAITAPTAPSAIAAYADYAGAHAQVVDGLHASMETEVSSVVGVETYRHAAGVFQTGSGESGTEALRHRSWRTWCRAGGLGAGLDDVGAEREPVDNRHRRRVNASARPPPTRGRANTRCLRSAADQPARASRDSRGRYPVDAEFLASFEVHVDGAPDLPLEALDISRLGVRHRIGTAVDHSDVQYLCLIAVHDLADVALVLQHQLAPVRSMNLTMSRITPGRGRRDRTQHVRLTLGVASHGAASRLRPRRQSYPAGRPPLPQHPVLVPHLLPEQHVPGLVLPGGADLRSGFLGSLGKQPFNPRGILAATELDLAGVRGPHGFDVFHSFFGCGSRATDQYLSGLHNSELWHGQLLRVVPTRGPSAYRETSN